MKSCPTCARLYPDDAGFCPIDGTPLKSATTVPPARVDDPRVGQVLCGRYEVRRIVADGGMGRVYEGRDLQTNTRVAIKALHPDVAKDEVSLERFKREWEISKILPHDYIVRVLDFQRDEAQNVWLLVMEYLEGGELRYALKRVKRLPPERLVRMLSQVAIGLDAAHAVDLVHRDLKPDNIFLCGTRDGDIVKILDFGSVKDKSKHAKKLTVLGTTIGSPFYMAPEQAQGLETLDARADVWALGAITYECVTGTVPFQGSNGPSILLAIMSEEPKPPTERVGDGSVPQALDFVIEEALAKNANIRIKSVGALADRVGEAYGLTGTHRAWAQAPEADLRALIESAKAAVKVQSVADPFAAPAPKVAPTMGAPEASAPRSAVDTALPPTIPGVPKGNPAWLIPAVVAGAALVLGGIIAVFMMAK